MSSGKLNDFRAEKSWKLLATSKPNFFLKPHCMLDFEAKFSNLLILGQNQAQPTKMAILSDITPYSRANHFRAKTFVS